MQKQNLIVEKLAKQWALQTKWAIKKKNTKLLNIGEKKKKKWAKNTIEQNCC